MWDRGLPAGASETAEAVGLNPLAPQSGDLVGVRPPRFSGPGQAALQPDHRVHRGEDGRHLDPQCALRLRGYRLSCRRDQKYCS